MQTPTVNLILVARAAMLRRGHADLQLIIGPGTLGDVQCELQAAIGQATSLFGMPMIEREDMEGFAVLPVEQKKATRGQLRAAAQWMLEQAIKEKREGKTDLAGALTTASEYSVAVGCDGEFGEG